MTARRNRSRWRLYRVAGPSMLPTLRPGRLVLVDCRRAPRIGDVVVAAHPETGAAIVKRITAIESDGYWLEGDAGRPESAATSTDSWVFGAVPARALIGVVRWPKVRRVD